jgi:hypothetical protein
MPWRIKGIHEDCWTLYPVVFECGLRGVREMKSPLDRSFLLWQSSYEETGKNQYVVFNDVRFYAGQPDPNNVSRFTITYQMDAESGTILGQLKDDDEVDLKPIDGPITKYHLTD